MAVRQERLDGTDWFRTWSDTGKSLLQKETGAIYGEAIDHISNLNNYHYEEVVSESDLEEISDNEACEIITGESEPGDGDISNDEALAIILGREYIPPEESEETEVPEE